MGPRRSEKRSVGFRIGCEYLGLPMLAAAAFLLITFWLTIYERAQELQVTTATAAILSMNTFHLTEARALKHAAALSSNAIEEHADHGHELSEVAHRHGNLNLEDSVAQLRETTRRLRQSMGTLPRTEVSGLRAPFSYVIDKLGLVQVPDGLRTIWEGGAGVPTIGTLLISQTRTCAKFCMPVGKGPPAPLDTIDELAEMVVGHLQPRLMQLNAAAIQWEQRLLFQTRVAVLLAVLAVIGGILFTRLRIIEPLLRRLDTANSQLNRRNSELERRVEVRTAELTEALAAANAANAARARLLASVNHELRTPMNGVLGVAALLERTKLDDKQAQLVGTVMESGRTLLRLIDDIMDIVCSDAGEIRIDSQPGNFRSLAASTLDLLRPVAEAKGLNLRVDSSQTLDLPVLVDADRLAQILSNLVGNAIKFTDSGSVGVGLRQIELPEAIVAEISVLDTGPGIPEAVQARIFDPFERGKQGSASPGTGLGLAVTRSLVQRMGGTIELDSAPGRGSCFTVRLPMRRAETASVDTDDAAA